MDKSNDKILLCLSKSFHKSKGSWNLLPLTLLIHKLLFSIIAIQAWPSLSSYISGVLYVQSVIFTFLFLCIFLSQVCNFLNVFILYNHNSVFYQFLWVHLFMIYVAFHECSPSSLLAREWGCHCRGQGWCSGVEGWCGRDQVRRCSSKIWRCPGCDEYVQPVQGSHRHRQYDPRHRDWGRPDTISTRRGSLLMQAPIPHAPPASGNRGEREG